VRRPLVHSHDDFEIGAALTTDGTQTCVWYDKRNRGWSGFKAAIRHEGGRTRYEIAIPMSAIQTAAGPPKRIGFNVLVGDADGGARLGWIDWTPGIGEEKAPSLYIAFRKRNANSNQLKTAEKHNEAATRCFLYPSVAYFDRLTRQVVGPEGYGEG
jgi:hypothetical protein